MTTTTNSAMLAAIAADLDDDTRRLAYADWLDENGDSDRAELIRVQCEIESIRRECWCGSCVGRRGGGQHHNGPCGIDRRNEQGVKPRNRERELIAAHPEWMQWECPTCGGSGKETIAGRVYYGQCIECGGAGDLLRHRPIAWDRGWPGWVHVERVSELVIDRGTDEYGYRHTDPTPLLTALATTPPWGVSLRGVIVDELRPAANTDGRWWWRDENIDSVLFNRLPDKPNILGQNGAWYPTEQSAIRAAAAASLEFGRKYK